MDDDAAARARRREGAVPVSDLGSRPGRAALRSGLVEVQPRSYLAQTQPYDVRAQLASLVVALGADRWAVMAQGALWLYGVTAAPEDLEVGVPLNCDPSVRPPVRCRRVVPWVLAGRRTVRDVPVVALEVAVIQWAEGRVASDVRVVVEFLVRQRRTTLARLRAKLRRGFAGSAVVRAVVDELAGGSMELEVRRLRAALEARGVLDLEAEVHFTNAAGASAYADLLQRATMTALEIDAALDHLRPGRFLADRRRDRWMLREHGVRTVRVDAAEVRADVEAVADELVWFFASRAGREAG